MVDEQVADLVDNMVEKRVVSKVLMKAVWKDCNLVVNQDRIQDEKLVEQLGYEMVAPKVREMDLQSVAKMAKMIHK